MGSFEVFSGGFEAMMGVGLLEVILDEIPNMLINLAVYIFTGLGLYTIAKRRGIHNPWLAWVPFANMWLLGCISDHYQSVVNGKVTRRRVALLVTTILLFVVVVAIVVLCIVMLFRMFTIGFETLDSLVGMDMIMINGSGAMEIVSSLVGPGVGMVLLSLILFPVSIIQLVFYCMALHDVYKSCEPHNAVLYLVLGIFLAFCVPIFLMICRGKDDGMPIRPTYAPPPGYGTPPYPPAP